MKNICVAINTIVNPLRVSLKSIYETSASKGDFYVCKSDGYVYNCFIFVVKGKLLLQTNKKLNIALEENKAVFVLDKEIKSYKCLEDDTVYFWTYFHYEGPSLPTNTPYTVENPSKMVDGFNNCCTLLNQQDNTALMQANITFAKFFLEGNKKLNPQNGDINATNIGVLNSIDYIHENLFRLPIVEDIAEMFGMSIKKYREEFEKVTGLTPSKYIKEKKLILTKNY